MEKVEQRRAEQDSHQQLSKDRRLPEADGSVSGQFGCQKDDREKDSGTFLAMKSAIGASLSPLSFLGALTPEML